MKPCHTTPGQVSLRAKREMVAKGQDSRDENRTEEP